MSPSTWRRRLRLPSCRSEPSRSASALRRGLLLASLTCLSFLTVLAGTAAAQDVTFSSDSYSVNEGDAVTPELVLSHSRSEDVTVYVQALGFGRARGGEDFAAGPWDVTVPAGRTRQSFSVATFGDYKVEGNEQFLLHIAPYGHSPGVRRSTSGTPDAVVTISDSTKISVRNDRLRVLEGSTATISLAIGTPARPTPFTLDYTLSGTTASGADVTGGFGARSITVPANATSVDIPIETAQDTVTGEDVEWFQVRLSTSTPGVHFTTTDIRIGIVDADTTRISVPRPRVQVTEGGTATARVAIRYPKSSSFTLDYTLSGDTASRGTASSSDVVGGFGARSITVPANASHVDISIATVQDTVHSERIESFRVRLSTTASEVAFDTLEFQVVISDDDTGASFASASSKTSERAHTHNVRVYLSQRPVADTTLHYTVGGTATPGSDYTALSGSVAVSREATTATIPVTILDDSAPEREETVVLTLTDAGGFVVGDTGTHTVTIAASEVPTVDFMTTGNHFAVDEDSGTFNLDVRLSEPQSQPITVGYEVTGSGIRPATSVSDYTALSGTVTIPAGMTTATIPVTIIDDNDQEGNESFWLTLVGGNGYGVSEDSDAYTELVVVIHDNEQLPVVTFPASTSTRLDEDAGTHNLTVTLSPAPNKNITVAYTVDTPYYIISPTPGSDYEPLSGELAIAQGATTATIPVTVIDDDVYEGNTNEMFRLRLHGGTGYRVGSRSYHWVVIADDERPTVASFTPASQNVVEGSGTRDVEVYLVPPPPSDITLNYTVGGTATADSDYTALSGSVTVSAGTVRATIPVTTLADSVQEDPETVVLTLAPGTGYGVHRTHSVHTLTIHTPSTVTFRRPDASAREEGGTHGVTVNLSPTPTFDFTLHYMVGGTATADSDYTALPGSVAVSRGRATATIPVPIINDSDHEDDETVVLTLTDDADYQVGDSGTHTLTIGASDLPPIPTVGFTSQVSLVNEDVGTHQVNLRLSRTYPYDITVNYEVLDSGIRPATSGSDYEPLSGTVTVLAGATTAAIPVTIIDDDDQEEVEDLVLGLVDGEGYKRTPDANHSRQVVIHDNEQLPVVSFPSSTTQLGEGTGTHNVTLNLSPAPDKDITVSYGVGDGIYPFSTPATPGSDYQPLSGELTVLAGATTATLPVTIIDDGAHEGYEVFGLKLQAGAGYVTTNSSDYREIIIVDDDPQIDVSFASASQRVVEGAGTRDVTVNLVPAPTADITLGYSVSGTASADADYTALSGTVAVSAGAATATIPVAITDDSDPEGEETVVLTLTGVEGHRKVRPSTHTLTIAASDGPPTMTTASFATASQSAGDESGTHNVTVNLNPAPASNITLSYTVGGTATPGSDYTTLSGTVAVSAGAVMATIPVTLLADNVQEDRETVVLTLAAGTGYELASPGTLQPRPTLACRRNLSPVYCGLL